MLQSSGWRHGLSGAGLPPGQQCAQRRSCASTAGTQHTDRHAAHACSMSTLAHMPSRTCRPQRHTCHAVNGEVAGGAGTLEQQPQVTGPLHMTTLEQLTSVERQPAPLWSTFCGVSGGCWQGTTAAFSPTTGEAEPVALDGDNKPVFDLHLVLVDDRLTDDDVERRVQHAVSVSDLQLRGDVTPLQDDVEWDTELIRAEEPGLAVFDGGSYSRGPMQLGVIGSEDAGNSGSAHPSGSNGDGGNGSGDSSSQHPAMLQYDSSGENSESDDEQASPQNSAEDGAADGAAAATNGSVGEEAAKPAGDADAPGQASYDIAAPDSQAPRPRQTAMIEQCIAWGGEQRVRFQVTLACEGLRPGEELDVEVLRIGVCREGWQCLTDNDACSVEDVFAPLSTAPKLDQRAIAGDYSVFDLSAVPVEETDPFTLETSLQLVYFSQETAQRWGPPEAGPADGAALWLPGNLLLQLRMVPPASRGREADASEGIDAASPRGLLLSCGWAPPDGRGLLSLVEREYDAAGLLTEVRSRTAVRGGWVGGRM